MAGLRKPVRRKDPSKPSTALILFLVFFIVLSLGLGVWGYYGYAGQEELRTKAKNAKATSDAGNLVAEYWEYLAYEARLATGGDPLTPAEMDRWAIARAEFNKDGGKFSKETTKPAMDKWVKDILRDKLGVDKDANAYPTNYSESLTKAEKDLKAAKATLAAKLTELDAANKRFAELDKNQKASAKKNADDIKKGNEDALAAARKKSEEAEEALKTIGKLIEEKGAIEVKWQEDVGKKDRQIKKLEDLIKAKTLESAEHKAGLPGGGAPGPLHSLLLDIAKGKTLWDTPLGKITRVDLQNGQVYLNIGSSSGLKPEATFMVFGSNSSGLPEKMLKATVEVVRVIDKTSSVARISSLYDADGQEIVLSDTAKGRLEREASNPLKEGDLLFNLFFGQRVAIAGVANLSGYSANSPREQMRELDNFTHLLNRMGVTVDAHLDLELAEVKGAIGPRTRYLILGDRLPVPPRGKDDPDKSQDPNAQVNEQIRAMQREAAEKGLFIISLDNFLNVSGLRTARSASSSEKSAFRPGLPVAGAGYSDLIGPGKKGGDNKK